MMAWLRLWTTGLTAIMALSVSLGISEDSGLPVVDAKKQGPAEIVRKENYPVLFRQKREWIWNSYYVEEEKPGTGPERIGKLKSSTDAAVRRFEITGDGANDIFVVDEKGDLFVTRSLDREERALYHLKARILDGNGRVIEDTGEFVVQVTDINDNVPVFSTFNGSVMERSPIGTRVVEVKATDADDPTTRNGDLRYSLIKEGDHSKFTIDSLTGVIICNTNTLDRETKSHYMVVVQAQDMGGIATGSTATTSVKITILDANDNFASFTQKKFDLVVPEDRKLNEVIGTLKLDDKDQIQNKEPIFTISDENVLKIFSPGLSREKDGQIILKQALDYETKDSYTFTVKVEENMRYTADNAATAIKTAQVNIRVLDVDEPPQFSEQSYNFTVREESMMNNIGRITAIDPDRAKNAIRYSISDKNCPIQIDPITGQLSTLRTLDREVVAKHMFQVKAQEEPSGLESFVKVNIIVEDVNDNPPELIAEDIHLCDSDNTGTVVGILRAADKDDQPAKFRFSLASESANFSIRDHGNNTAAIVVVQGPFSMDDPRDYSVDVSISDNGIPVLTSRTTVKIKVCQCDGQRNDLVCKALARGMGVSAHALIAILLCILTILVIVILFVMRKRYQKDSLANMKNSGEIHEQLVTYDEEGGGEMDTNGYDVSILTSACNDGSLLRHPDRHPHPSLYAMVQKPPQHTQPTACKGDMAAMIEVKKDEADHDRDGIPYDTLHIYGYEGPESLAGSLSSLNSTSTGSNLDYDFLNDWGPRFKPLAELYGVDGPDYYHQY
ncbi:cadherin-5 [Scomber japonicus]|uniref:cadherin-5 n=1 Tax=Scomber japonicus TaxID=13676 RepID=UPI002305DF69|nr:cadherin-5 [Scomber japonicus]